MKKLSKKKIKNLIFLLTAEFSLLVFGIIFKAGALELVSSMLGVLSCCLNSFGSRYCFYCYCASSFLYGIFAFSNRQFGEAIINLLYSFPFYLVSSIKMFGSRDEFDADVEPSTITVWERRICILLLPIFTIAYGYVLKLMNSNLPYVNALGTILALECVFLANKKRKEQWNYWTIYSFVLISMWAYSYFALGQEGLLFFIANIIYLIMNINGIIVWNKKYRELNVTFD